MPLNPFLRELRTETYVQPFPSINFREYTDTVAPTDSKRPTAMIVKAVNHVLLAWEV